MTEVKNDKQAVAVSSIFAGDVLALPIAASLQTVIGFQHDSSETSKRT